MKPSPAAPKTQSSRRLRIWGICLLVVILAGVGLALLLPLGKGGNKPAPTSSAKKRPDDTLVDTNLDSSELASGGLEALKQDNPRKAIEFYKAAIATAPGQADLHYNLALAYVRLRDDPTAEGEFREALRISPEYAEAHNNLGNLLLRLGRLTEAETHFKEALRIQPDYAIAFNNLGIVYQREKKQEKATSCFQNAVRCNTNYWQAQFNLASSYLAQGDRAAGIAALKETLRINPSAAVAERELAKLQAGPVR